MRWHKVPEVGSFAGVSWGVQTLERGDVGMLHTLTVQSSEEVANMFLVGCTSRADKNLLCACTSTRSAPSTYKFTRNLIRRISNLVQVIP